MDSLRGVRSMNDVSSLSRCSVTPHSQRQDGLSNNSEIEDLLVFGYASTIFGNSEKAEWIAEERHLISWPGDPNLLIDRYDCRLYLGDLSEFDRNDLLISDIGGRQEHFKQGCEEVCPTEALEEEMCEEERYRDLLVDIKRVEAAEEEDEKQKRAEIGFTYEENGNSGEPESSSSEEEVDEPYQPPEGIKLPLGMNLPDSMKLNAIIERTATFVVTQGAQMEIVIKAKQRDCSDQFGFLEFDHPLNPYYKYISKMIREKKYIPAPHVCKKRPKPKKLRRLQEEEQRRKKEIEEARSRAEEKNSSEGSDIDSDGEYLHPLLMGGLKTNDTSNRSHLIGPVTREEHMESCISSPPVQPKIDYNIEKANDMYSSLFKNLANIVQSHSAPALKTAENEESSKFSGSSTDEKYSEDNYVEWYESFYHEKPPTNSQPTVLPPPPNMSSMVNYAAEYVAKYGCEAEYHLARRTDIDVDFVRRTSPYYSYYQSRIRFYQWTQAVAAHAVTHAPFQGIDAALWEDQKLTGEEKAYSTGCTPTTTPPYEDKTQLENQTSLQMSDLSESKVEGQSRESSPTVHLNRRMRRRGLQEQTSGVNKCQPKEANEGGDRSLAQLSKVHSSPAFLSSSGSLLAKPLISESKRQLTGPISFSIAQQKNDDSIHLSASAVTLGAYDDEENDGDSKAIDVTADVVTNVNCLYIMVPPKLAIPPPPSAPVPLASGLLAMEGSIELQHERKRRARLFMEKILNEKRAAKLKAQNEEKLKEEEEARRKMEEETKKRENAELRRLRAAALSSSKYRKLKKQNEIQSSVDTATAFADNRSPPSLVDAPSTSCSLALTEGAEEGTTSTNPLKRDGLRRKEKNGREESEEEGEICSEKAKRRANRNKSALPDEESRRRLKKRRRHRSRSRSRSSESRRRHRRSSSSKRRRSRNRH
ncbi:hypothetical protein AB6A40_001435 [Gnathostoma spinigerum]|uniref:SURP motif domain-containing protein n=1 Tax=Gnathostoma spinigerum TaxID=75299 RepID=A0ABD6EBD7_9BILA